MEIALSFITDKSLEIIPMLRNPQKPVEELVDVAGTHLSFRRFLQEWLPLPLPLWRQPDVGGDETEALPAG